MRISTAAMTILCCGAAAALAAPGPVEQPPVAFAAEAPPPPPDYDRPGSWAARPGAEGAAGEVPPNAVPAMRDPPVDVFYVHPTTYRSQTRWNQRLDDAATNAWTDSSVVARQASAFSGCCRIFAPRYRQASLRAFASMTGNGGRAYDLAYRDIERAFDHYLAHDNHGRPFILAGHSQGALHVTTLLRERIDGRPIARRMVAAYVLGYPIAEGEFGTAFRTLRPCTAPRQTGCVVGWNSFLAGSDATGYAARGRQRFVNAHGTGTGTALLCTDPLALDGSRRAAGLGTLPEGEGAALPSLVPDAVTAACDADGVLKVALAPPLALTPLPGGNMHYHDIALFYADLRADATRRSAAFRRRGPRS